MRRLVIAVLSLLLSCAKSERRGDDEPADRAQYCRELEEMACDVCDPERRSDRCSSDRLAWCDGAGEWFCVPLPTVGQYVECRAAFERALTTHDCSDPVPPYDVPECARLESCRD